MSVAKSVTKKCRRDSGRISMIRGVAANVRYVGRCDDCDFATEPTNIKSAHRTLNAHRKSR